MKEGGEGGNGAGTWYVRQLAVTNDNGDSVSWRRARRAVRNGNGIVVERERRRSKSRVGDRGRGKDIGKAGGEGGARGMQLPLERNVFNVTNCPAAVLVAHSVLLPLFLFPPLFLTLPFPHSLPLFPSLSLYLPLCYLRLPMQLHATY